MADAFRTLGAGGPNADETARLARDVLDLEAVLPVVVERALADAADGACGPVTVADVVDAWALRARMLVPRPTSARPTSAWPARLTPPRIPRQLASAVGWVTMAVGLVLIVMSPPADAPRIQVDPPAQANDHARLAFVNGAPADDLRAAGVYPRGVELILAGRPFPSWAAFTATPGIGSATERAVRRGAKRAQGG